MIKRFEQFVSGITVCYKYIQRIKALEMPELEPGMKGSHVMCIFYLEQNPDGLTAAQLSNLCQEDKAAISRTLSELVERGFVAGGEKDGKRYRALLVLTEKGQALAEKVDGNVLRVMSRIACSEEDIAKESTKKKLQQDLAQIMPAESGEFNQALMELGATVCLPNGKPLCDRCPVMHLCKAFHAGRETELPVKTGKKERRIEKRTVYLVFAGGKVLLHKRGKTGLLAGLWEFPNIQRDGKTGEPAPARISERFADGLAEAEILSPMCGVKVKKGKKAKHIFSHVEWHMEGIEIKTETGGSDRERFLIRETGALIGKEPVPEDWVFVTPQQLRETYAVPSAFEVYVKEVLKEEREAAE